MSREEECSFNWEQYMQPKTFVAEFLHWWSAGCRSWKIWTFFCTQRNYSSWNLHSALWGICSLDALLTDFLWLKKVSLEFAPPNSDQMCCEWLFNTLLVSSNIYTCFYWVHRKLVFVAHAAVITVHGNNRLCLCKAINILWFSLWYRHFLSNAAAQSNFWNRWKLDVLT